MTKNVSNQTVLTDFRPLSAPHPSDEGEVDGVPRPIVTRFRENPDGLNVSLHHHRRDQLLYAWRGVMTVTTQRGIWVVPPQRAVWVPALTDHKVLAEGPLTLCSLFLVPGLASDLPRHCEVVTVSPLLRELILYAVRQPQLYDEEGKEGRAMDVLLDQIKTSPVAPLHLPWPSDDRLRPICEALKANPADATTLEEWANIIGTSSRTLARLFMAKTGTPFSQWRQQIRLLEALTLLAMGQPVTTIAFDLGYESQSAFIAMFKKALGQTPGKYFRP